MKCRQASKLAGLIRCLVQTPTQRKVFLHLDQSAKISLLERTTRKAVNHRESHTAKAVEPVPACYLPYNHFKSLLNSYHLRLRERNWHLSEAAQSLMFPTPKLSVFCKSNIPGVPPQPSFAANYCAAGCGLHRLPRSLASAVFRLQAFRETILIICDNRN